MNDQPATQDEQDDAAFRARLAPLASEVLPAVTGVSRPSRGGRKGSVLALPSETLPPAPAPEPTVVARGRGKARVAALVGLAAVALGSAAVWAYFGWPRAAGPPYTELSGRIDAGAGGSPAAPSTALSGESRPETGPMVDGRGGDSGAPAGDPDIRTVTKGGETSPRRESEIKIAGTRLSGEGRPLTEPGGAAVLPSIGTRPGDTPKETATTVSHPPTGAPMAASETEAMVALLLRRGNEALAVGDIVAARLLFERAAAQGSGAAATAAGKTYDVDFLLRVGARGIRADPAAATAWFRKAAALGDAEGQARLARMEGQVRK